MNNRPRRDSSIVPLTPQSDALTHTGLDSVKSKRYAQTLGHWDLATPVVVWRVLYTTSCVWVVVTWLLCILDKMHACARSRRSAPLRVRTPCTVCIQADWTGPPSVSVIVSLAKWPSQGSVWVSGRSASCLSAGILQSANGPFTLHAGTCTSRSAHVAIVAVSRRGYYGYLGFMKFMQNSVHHNFVAKKNIKSVTPRSICIEVWLS